MSARGPSSALAIDVSLRNLVLRDGRVVAPQRGGCIYALPLLTLENVEVSECEGLGAVSAEDTDLTVIDSIPPSSEIAPGESPGPGAMATRCR